MIDPAEDAEGRTIPFTEYRKKMEHDDNNWWRTSSGHQLNLFEDACRIIDTLTALLKESISIIYGLAGQQAMEDNWYVAPLEEIEDKLKEFNND